MVRFFRPLVSCVTSLTRYLLDPLPCLAFYQDVEHWCLSPPAIMVGALAYLDARWGGIKEYCDSIGFDAAWQAQLIRALTE